MVRSQGYKLLTKTDLIPQPGRNIFYDPADTELGALLASTLVTADTIVVDLASGSGAAAAALARFGARHSCGVDISDDSLLHASETYRDLIEEGKLSFQKVDFVRASTQELLSICDLPARPSLIASNPAYVPLPDKVGKNHASIYGGEDGLLFVPHIIRHAVNIGADCCITVGSYSSPKKVVQMMLTSGFQIHSIAISPLPLGDITKRHPEKILELERNDEAVLWRDEDGEIKGYFIFGIACRNVRDGVKKPDSTSTSAVIAELWALLKTASRADDISLSSLETAALSMDVTTYACILPSPENRHHW